MRKRPVRQAIIMEREEKSEAIPYNPDYYTVITDADYPVPVGYDAGGNLVYKGEKK